MACQAEGQVPAIVAELAVIASATTVAYLIKRRTPRKHPPGDPWLSVDVLSRRGWCIRRHHRRSSRVPPVVDQVRKISRSWLTNLAPSPSPSSIALVFGVATHELSMYRGSG